MKESLDPKAWWNRAMQDFRVARLAAKDDVVNLAATICYCCQQACEKMLKAYLLSTGWKLVKTHDLRMLANEAKKTVPALSLLLPLLLDLNADFNQSRYPFTFDETVGDADAKQAIETMERLELLLKEHVLTDPDNAQLKHRDE